MTTRTHRMQALRQALVLALVAGAAVAAVLAVRQHPAGPDELKIAFETLRSQAAELTLVNEQAGGALPPRFVSAHATQLADAIGQTRDELARMHPRPELRGLREEGLAHARRLLDSVEEVRRSGHALPPASQARIVAEATQLRDREERLRR
jgi:hypothetical protein